MPDIKSLVDLEAESRPLRTFAYLTACRDELAAKDAIDCLLPFVIAGVRQQRPNYSLDDDRVIKFLASLGLNVPKTVLYHLKERLRERGILDDAPGGDIILAPRAGEQETSVDLAADFDEIERKIQRYAALDPFRVEAPPVSKSWSEALIAVLRTDTVLQQLIKKQAKTTRAPSGTLVSEDPVATERLIIGRFVEHCASDPQDQSTSDSIVKIYSGVKIEDFIQDIQLFSSVSNKYQLSVYYDTPVLLRLLGFSGPMFKAATLRMHTALTNLGCKAKYLDITKSEVARKSENIASNPEQSHPETYDAYMKHEFILKDIKDYYIQFPAILSEEFGITPAAAASSSESAKWGLKPAEHNRLVRTLEAESHNWAEASIENDARVFSEMLKLRRGHVTDQIADARHVFVSVNPLLQRITKDFCKTIPYYKNSTKQPFIPTVLLVGQMASLAWLSTAQEIDQRKQITRELLVTCYNAVRPSRDWAKRFMEVFEEYGKNNPRDMLKMTSDVILFKTVRSFIQDKSRNQPRQIQGASLREALQEAAKQRARDEEREREVREALQRENEELRRALQQREAERLEEEERLAAAERRAEAERLEEAERQRRLRELEERERNRPPADASRQTAEISPRTPPPARPPHPSEGLKLAALGIFAIMFLGCVYFATKSPWVLTAIPVILVGAPIFFAFYFESHRLPDHDILRSLQIAAAAIPVIGRVFAHSKNSNAPPNVLDARSSASSNLGDDVPPDDDTAPPPIEKLKKPPKRGPKPGKSRNPE